MQWHSDGAQGEATMLLSLDGIDDDMGCLKIVPGSHRKYVPGTGHSEVTFLVVVLLNYVNICTR